MGSKAGHVAPGIGFLVIGLWHLFNHVKLHTTHPISYSGPTWFPVPKFRHAELVFIIIGTTASIVTELFIGPSRHHPLGPDMTIPSYHLHTFEHASISLALLLHGAFALALDRPQNPNPKGPSSASGPKPNRLSFFVTSIAFAQELLLFRLHSADHAGPEGHYHLFLQLIIAVSLVTTVMGIGFSGSFMVGFVRSFSLVLQGIWFVVIGVMLWTPAFLPKGCFLKDINGRIEATCSGEESLHRAKSLINLEFSWYLTATTALGMLFYFVVEKIYAGRKVEYASLPRTEERDEYLDDVEFQKKGMIMHGK